MRMSVILMALAVAAPARAQSPIYGNADLGKSIAAETRLSPEEAVRVLRGSHSIADLTDYRSPGQGPTVVVMGESTTPWDWPASAFEPIRPLGNYYDGNLFAPIEYGYAPYYAATYLNRPRHTSRGRSAVATVTSAHAVQAPPPPAPPSSAPRHLVMPAQTAGRRR
jgi:hypothetical protein